MFHIAGGWSVQNHYHMERDNLEFVKNDTHYSKYYDGMYILFKTGMRISEFTGLTLSDIDMENKWD